MYIYLGVFDLFAGMAFKGLIELSHCIIGPSSLFQPFQREWQSVLVYLNDRGVQMVSIKKVRSTAKKAGFILKTEAVFLTVLSCHKAH